MVTKRRLDMIEWGRWSSGSCARDWYLTIRTNGTCTIHPGEWDTQNSLGFWDISRSPNPGQTPRHSDSRQTKKKKERKKRKEKKEEKNCRIVDFSVLVDHRIKLREHEKRNKYLDLARELNKLWKWQRY